MNKFFTRPGQRRKFGNEPIEVNDEGKLLKFHSKAEAARYAELKLLLKAGKISDLELQPRFKLISPCKKYAVKIWGKKGARQCVYTADFSYLDLENDGALVVEDVKGYVDDTAKLRIAIFEAFYGVRVRLIRMPSRPF